MAADGAGGKGTWSKLLDTDSNTAVIVMIQIMIVVRYEHLSHEWVP